MLGGLWETGRDSAQMIGFELPLDDTLVKNPPFCPLLIAGDRVKMASLGLGDVVNFHTSTWLPPLLTTRAAPSVGSTKYDSPHQQPPIWWVPRTLFFAGEYPPRWSSFMKYMFPSLPAATARCGVEPAWSGRTITPPEPKSVSPSSRLLWFEGVNKSTTVVRSDDTLIVLS